ncbi:Scr1 family TA system antitoxin-like transcriptional regulator [Streptomyces sp. 4N509B]|uniref:Scr1 family TA system antitoxin-like transcriptional regulator n=1 Tax=Streptomyces sp. 4N509B TaxID=3457413 RepID=UPI003FD6560C
MPQHTHVDRPVAVDVLMTGGTMPPREVPTAREARLGAELRKLRERAGKAAHEAAAHIGTDRAKMSNIESGRRGISEERIRRLAHFYLCDDEPLIDSLCAIAHEHRGKQWWERYRGVLPPGSLDVSELEHHAVRLSTVSMLLVPGLFQTPGYARAIFGSAIPRPRDAELDARVEHRVARSQIFQRPNPPPCEVIIHEAALRMRYGGRGVARAQLEHLLDVADWPSVTLRVIPFALEEVPGHGQSMLYAEGPVPQLDTVQLDTPFGGAFLHTEPELHKYRRLFGASSDLALGPEESRQLVRYIAREM